MFWDFDAQRLQARIDRAIPGRVNVIHSSSDDGRLHVVKSSSTAHPPQWSLFDEHDGRMVLLGRSYPDLETAALSAPTTTYVTARDGKELQVFLTVPKDRDPRQLPMILFPHGGPASRSPGAYNYWTQWFVSRGWAVLEPRFRGTEGYGDEFLRAGFQRWGLEMQDDLTDAVQYAIRSGIANANRICIVGSGYGGYAALMGAVKTPDLYPSAPHRQHPTSAPPTTWAADRPATARATFAITLTGPRRGRSLRESRPAGERGELLLWPRHR